MKTYNTNGAELASVLDGDDVAVGATTDAAVVTDTTGTISGKLRGLVKWAFERMPTALGQALASASFPVTIASDQSRVLVRQYDEDIGAYNRISPIGGLIVEQTTRLIGTQFEGSLANGTADNFWETARGTNATAVIASKIATLTSGTTNADWCSVATISSARFLFANPNMFRALVKFSSVAAADTTTHIGAISMTSGAPQNGYSFEVDGAGAISVASWNGGSKVLNVASGFNGNLGSTYSVPDTNMHAYEIIYFAAKVWFFIDRVLLHSAAPTTAIFSGEMSVPIGLSVIVGPSATSRILECWNASTLRLGKELTRPQSVYIAAGATTLCKTGAGTLHSILLGDGAVGTVSVYDGLTAGGTLLIVLSVLATTPPNLLAIELDFGVGLTVVTTAGTKVTMIFD